MNMIYYDENMIETINKIMTYTEHKNNDFNVKLKSLGVFVEYMFKHDFENILNDGLKDLHALELRFKSGNSIPVERVRFKDDCIGSINTLFCLVVHFMAWSEFQGITIKNGYIYQWEVAPLSNMIRFILRLGSPDAKVGCLDKQREVMYNHLVHTVKKTSPIFGMWDF